MTDTIDVAFADGVFRITLNNPARHNALGRAELEGLAEILDQLSTRGDVRVLLLTGAGDKTFCAGAALPELRSGEISGSFFSATVDRIASLSMPTVCLLNGNVFGGGTELALACDFRIGIAGTRMRVPAAAIGLCYPPSGIARIVQKLGPNAARRMLVAAEEFDARAMLGLGFLDHLVQPADMNDYTDNYLQQIAQLAPGATAAMKRIVGMHELSELNKKEAQKLEQACADSADLQEGFLAAQEKRPPVFTGS